MISESQKKNNNNNNNNNVKRNLVGKRLKVKLKIYDVTISEKTISMHILFNIARSKGNETSKFGQLTEYNM